MFVVPTAFGGTLHKEAGKKSKDSFVTLIQENVSATDLPAGASCFLLKRREGGRGKQSPISPHDSAGEKRPFSTGTACPETFLPTCHPAARPEGPVWDQQVKRHSCLLWAVLGAACVPKAMFPKLQCT